METFTGLKPFTENPFFHSQQKRSADTIRGENIDPPVAEIVSLISSLPYCFSLQSCCGHFIYGNKDLLNTDPVQEIPSDKQITYRIAFIAFCADNSPEGVKLLQEIKSLVNIDPEYIHFGCAEWFWDLQVNSFVLQVVPERYKTCDKIVIYHPEALHIEKIRDELLDQLGLLFKKKMKEIK